MNQMRALDDELENPDWTIPDAPYQILTLSRSLSNNQSITVRLQSNKVSKTLMSAQNRLICRPSMTDIYFMEKPQEYLDDEFVSDEYRPKSDIEPVAKRAISFENPKIITTRTGRQKMRKD
jgi:hypothetical protein